MRTTTATVLFLALLVAAAPASGAQYRRWISPKPYQCITGAGNVQFVMGNQNVEFANLPATAQFTLDYIDNGIVGSDGPFPVEQTTGTHNYGSFAEVFPSYPLDFQFRTNTLVGGHVVYQSSVHAVCFSDASGSMATVNRDTGPAPTQYRRWTSPKTFSCSDSGGVHVLLDNQNVEFNDLPVNAQFILHYIDNGVDSSSGPFTVEQTSGTHNYGSFSEPFAAYPLSFRFRIDTLIDGVLAYQSTIGVNCSGNASGIPGIVDNRPDYLFADGFQ